MHLVRFLIINLLLLISIQVSAADIQVSVDRNPVNINDSFQITFTASEEPDANPDFSPLQNNFEIIDQQRSSNASWVNGHGSRTEQWVVSVLAKQSGELLIPPIAFGSDSSKPLIVNVNENQSAPQSNDELFMEVTATPDKPYVQSQVLYTLRLYRRVQITQARLDEPQLKDALLEKLGEDNTYTTQIKGVNYWVTERKYAIFPQKSGVFTLAPLTLNAQVLVQRQPRFNGFFNQQTTENRRISSNAVTLNVQAVPAGFNNAAWLSAESLELSEDWSDKSLQTRVGEPLTRTVRLSAKGATVGQLPELSSQTAVDGIKTYPDQPLLKEDKQSDGLTALREEKIAFIPSKPGVYTLPAFEINWFNTKTQRIETARLPSVTLKALASQQETRQQPVVDGGGMDTKTLQPVAAADSGNVHIWQGVSAFLALGWLLTMLVFYRKKPLPVAPSAEQAAESAIEKTLKHACWENNPQAVKQLLLQWGRARFGADSLGAIAHNCPLPLSEEIDKLNQHLYSGRQHIWKGEDLWRAFSKNRLKPNAKPVQDGGLEPLYKL